MAALAFLAKLSANLHDAWSKPNETSPPAPTAGFQCCPDRDVCPYPTLTAYTRCLHTMLALSGAKPGLATFPEGRQRVVTVRGPQAMLSIATALDALNFLAADVRNLFGPSHQRLSRHRTALDPDRRRSDRDGQRSSRHRAADPDRRRHRRHPRQTRRHCRDHGGDVGRRDHHRRLAHVLADGRWATGVLAVPGDAFVPAVFRADPRPRSAGSNCRGGSAATPLSTTAATSPSPSLREASAISSPSARSSCWCRSSPR